MGEFVTDSQESESTISNLDSLSLSLSLSPVSYTHLTLPTRMVV